MGNICCCCCSGKSADPLENLFGKDSKEEYRREAFQEFSAKAEAGNLEARAIRAFCLEVGVGVKAQRSMKNIADLTEAAKKGDRLAMTAVLAIKRFPKPFVKEIKEKLGPLNEADMQGPNAPWIYRCTHASFAWLFGNHKFAFARTVKEEDTGMTIVAQDLGLPVGHEQTIAYYVKSTTDPEAFMRVALELAEKDPYCSCTAARFYAEGTGAEQSYVSAAKFAKQAADAGNGEGHAILGRLYASGLGVPLNLETAKEHYEKAIELGYYDALVGSAELFQGEERVQTLLRAIDQGEFAAYGHLAELYLEGAHGVEKNLALAKEYFQKGADLLNEDTICRYTKFLANEDLQSAVSFAQESGDSIEKMNGIYEATRLLLESKEDTPKALEILKACANTGYSRAIDRLISIFQSPEHADFQAVVHWSDIGTSKTKAMKYSRELGKMYYEGKGTEVNYEMAYKYAMVYRDISKGKVISYLPEMYEKGRGLPIDLKMAASLYKQQAESGDLNGMLKYARCLEYGIGVPRNIAEAIDWTTRVYNS